MSTAATLRRYASFYRATAALGMKSSMQYRGAMFLGMFGVLGEPVVYLVVWTAVADANGGAVAGLARADIVAYYIVWTLVRMATSSFSPVIWGRRIVDGTLSDMLLQPILPMHHDLGRDLGSKAINLPLWLPIGVGLGLIFRPSLELSIGVAAAFVFTLLIAWLIRTMLFSVVGLSAFRTTQISAAVQVYMAFELLLSGRLVPIAFYPSWLETTAAWLPFYRTFGFPIDVFTTSMSGADIARGTGASLAWLVGLIAVYAFGWKRSVSHFSAVDG